MRLLCRHNGIRVVGLALTLSATLFAGMGTASARDGGHDQVGAHGDGASPAFSFSFDVRRDEDGKVGGYFRAKLTEPLGEFVAPEGPPTCVSVRGNTVSFVYRLAGATKPGVATALGSILITATDNGSRGDTIGFLGPSPALLSCGMSAPQLPVTSGGVEVDH